MQLKLMKKPKNVKILEGFPGFGLIGTISTEFLLDHLDVELIGKIWFDELPAMVAIHQSEVVEPIGIFYNKKNNLVIIHGVTAVSGLEWMIADAIVDVAKQLGAKEIISIEGVGSQEQSPEPKTFFYGSTSALTKKLKEAGCEDLKEGIIMGVTGSVLVKADGIPHSCVFVETHSNLPDSKASAKIVEVLDKYLGLSVDPKPLLEQAKVFEQKLKGLMDQSQAAAKLADKKRPSYFG